MAWRCFMVEPSEFCRRTLRRYGARHDTCTKTFPGVASYHNAEVVIDEQFEAPPGSERGGLKEDYPDEGPWPKACDGCGYPFHPEDHWQVNVDRLYKGCPDGKLYCLRDLPPGAIWRAYWMEDIVGNPYGNDAGEVWALMMPGGDEWFVYSRAGNSKERWNIQGELPRITVTPSILIQGVGTYHGYVKDGVITDDVDGRVFPRFPSTA